MVGGQILTNSGSSIGNGQKYSYNPLLQEKKTGRTGKSLSEIRVFQSDLTEVFFDLQECVYDLWVKVGPLFLRDDLNGFLMREWNFVNPVAGQGIIGIG